MNPTVWLDGLSFPEDPRWRDGALWFSDFGQRVVRKIDARGVCEEIAHVEARPSGLGWLPDGSLLVVSMDDRKLMRLREGTLEVHADLAPFTVHACNDMVVDSRNGNAYVGHMGFDLFARPRRVQPASLVLVRPDGTVAVAADELLFPNGVVITPERTLIVAETMGARLTAFDIADDGSLHNRRLFASIPGRSPDGICVDAEGAVWVADAAGKACVRVRDGGAITDVIATSQGCYACALGGDDGHTLFLCTAEGFGREALARTTGRIERVRVPVPAA